MISRIKGTQDVLNLTVFNNVIGQIKNHLALYSFIEIQTPLIESLDLFQRSLGQDTDVVSKEMFVIESRQQNDSSERICLRPEMTASMVRAFNENGIQQVPWKVFSYGPCFRYERPQKGRYRQFNQISMEIIGASSIGYDAQFITMLDRFFNHMLQEIDYTLEINFLGCSDDRIVFTDALRIFLNNSSGICSQCQERKERNIMRIFDCKNSVCKDMYLNAPIITDYLCDCCGGDWHQLQEYLKALSVNYIHRPTLVRGLDYYNKTVFEFASNSLGAQNAFCGGGRYNNLAKELGAKEDQPSIGAAIGVERFLLLLEACKNESDASLPASLFSLVMPMTIAQHTQALLIADMVRADGLQSEVLLEGSIKSMFRKADKLGATYVLIIGETEQQNKIVKIKNMKSGHEQEVPYDQIIHYLKQ